MNEDSGRIVPLRIDLSELVRRSVATLYSHLVTRQTGEALRLGIQSQVEELGAFCLSVLDFAEVRVLDYSCADEMVAKLLQRFEGEQGGVDAYFVARSVRDAHREVIEAVLERHDLALVAELDDRTPALLGTVPDDERIAWRALAGLQRGDGETVAREGGLAAADAAAALERLQRRRVVVRRPSGGEYVALTALLSDG